MAHELSDVVPPDVCFRSADYQLLEFIGKGGFGQVYKAIHHRTQKAVAIKFLTLNSNESTEKRQRNIARFHRECDLVRRLNHPNIVSLTDKGQQGGELLYAVYEFVDGVTLKDYLTEHGAMPATEAAETMASVLDALAHAHEQGIIHRDIKPANIMLYHVGAKRHVKVLDFGIGTLKHDARQEDYQTLTLTQETLGTPTYSAPEQLRGEPALPQTDLYVWGLVFLECLTGAPTIQGKSLAAVFHQQLSAANVSLGPLAGHHSARFFRRVLNKKALERPGNTVEVYQEFRQLHFADLVSDLSVVSHPGTSISQDFTEINPIQASYSQITERKQITVMSVILAHHTIDDFAPPDARSFAQSPSEQNALIKSHAETDIPDMIHTDQIHQSIDIAVRYGATHTGTLGDTLLFYFGYPVASDNDSRLCARAALDIWHNLEAKQEQIRARHGFEIEMRAGINSGMMLSLEGGIPEGQVASQAMALARIAPPGQIICASPIRAMLENQLLFEPFSPNTSSRFPPLYLLQGERLSEAFGFLRSTQKHQAFFGREELLERLMNNGGDSHHPQEHSPQLLHIQGEAGIGKSRLLFELNEKSPGQTQLILQCLPEYQNNALHPVLSFLISRYQLDHQDGYQHLCQIAETLPCKTQMKNQCLVVLWIWCHPLSPSLAHISVQEEKQHRQLLVNMSLRQQREYLFWSLSYLLCQQEARPLPGTKQSLFICEDLHWADPTTIAFIRYFIESDMFAAGNFRWCNTSRTPLPSALTALSAEVLEPGRLSIQDCRQFIHYLFDHQPVHDNVTALLTERSDGNPLFLEELVSYTRHQGLVRQVDGYFRFVVDEPELQVPETLRESLQYQLANLTFARDTALLAAAIGRTFSESLLFRASDKDKTQIQADLDELQRAKLIFIQRHVEDNQYVFQHALIRDAIYESATSHHRIHRQIALALEALSDEINSDEHKPTVPHQPELLAQHWAATDTPERAIACFIQAGKAASDSFILDDAIHNFNKALDLVDHAQTTIAEGKTIDTHVTPEFLSQQTVSARTGLADSFTKQGKHELSRQHCLCAIRETEITAPQTCANLYIRYGQSWEIAHHHANAMKAYHQAEQLLKLNPLRNQNWWQIWVNIQTSKLSVFYWRNDIVAMRQLTEEIAPKIDSIDDPLSKAQLYDARLQLQFRQTRYRLNSDDVEIAEKAYQASLDTSNSDQQIHSLFSLGVSCLFSQRYNDAHLYLHQALERSGKEGFTTFKTRCLSYLALLYRMTGNPDVTLDFATQAMDCAEKSDMQDYIALASANQAWVAYRHQSCQEALHLLSKSNEIWQALSAEYPFALQWVSLLVELDLLLSANNTPPPTSRLVEILTTLTDTSQQNLPDPIMTPLNTALRQSHDSALCYHSARRACAGAKRLGYL